MNACIYLIHTRGDVYAEPYAFRPERFLDSPPETYSWIPFGGGTRRCIGAAFAGLEMRTVLRTILARARIEPATDAPEPVAPAEHHALAEARHPAVLRERLRPSRAGRGGGAVPPDSACFRRLRCFFTRSRKLSSCLTSERCVRASVSIASWRISSSSSSVTCHFEGSAPRPG